MNGNRANAAGPPEGELSERDRRFALLALMLAPDPRRPARRHPSPRASSTENAMDHEEQVHEQPIVTETNKERVRAGVTGHNVRTVLIASLALVIVGFIAVALLMGR